MAERVLDEEEEVHETPKKTPSHGRSRHVRDENNGDNSDEDEPPPAAKATPRGRGRASRTATKEDNSDEDDAAAEENGASDASDVEHDTPITPARRAPAAAVTSKPSVRGSGRRSTAHKMSFKENSGSESDGDEGDEEAESRRGSGRNRRARDDSESCVPPKKRMRGRH